MSHTLRAPTASTDRSRPDDRVHVTVVLGGQSSEHSISCLSAASVLSALDQSRFDVSAVGITTDGQWYRVSSDPTDWGRSSSGLPQVTPGSAAVYEPVDLSVLRTDVVFPVLHGPYGEDGTIQGLLELLGVPYVGSGVLASAVMMDKQATKVMLAAAGLPVGPYVAISDADWVNRPSEVLDQVNELNFPVFVKPARAGSSIGITKVHHPEGVQAAVEAARAHDRKVVVEASVQNAREIECGVLAQFGTQPPKASLCAEIAVGGAHEFYDFDAKYLDDSATLTVPADLSDVEHKQLADLAVEAFTALGAQGLARVDFFQDTDGQVVINEVNTMPGFTNISMFPKMWEATGLEYPQLVDHLVAVALERGTGLR